MTIREKISQHFDLTKEEQCALIEFNQQALAAIYSYQKRGLCYEAHMLSQEVFSKETSSLISRIGHEPPAYHAREVYRNTKCKIKQIKPCILNWNTKHNWESRLAYNVLCSTKEGDLHLRILGCKQNEEMLKDLANQEFDCLHTHEQDLSPYAGSHYPLDEEILVIDTGDQSPGYVLACYPYARV